MHHQSRALRDSLMFAAAAVSSLSVAFVAEAQTYLCELVAPSSVTNAGGLNLPLAGTFIGNYDAVTNPTGTQTRPGLFGGSGNNPINYSSTIVADAGFDASPTGSFTIQLSPMGGTITGLEMDLTGGVAQQLGITLNINYQTFRTFSPNSAFPGGVTIPIPIAGGEITAAIVTQTAPAMVITGTPDAQGTPFMAAVPVLIQLQGQITGAPLGGEPQPGLLPLMGRFNATGSAISLASTVAVDPQTVELPALPPVQSQPFPLPTVLPPGGTANLLISGTFGAGTISTGINGTLVAQGTRALIGDVNVDGFVNAIDLGTLLAAWATSLASCDLDDSGTVNGTDLAILLTNWS